MAVDVDLARSLTPGCRHVVHLNHAGASLAPSPVLDTVIGHLQREATIGGYEAAAEAADRLEAVYASVATLLGARSHEIALVENATRAWDLAFYAFSFAPGDRILTGRSEYASNVIALLQVARRTGAEVVLVDDDEHGQVDVEALAAAVDERTRLIALTHVPTSGGLVNPAAAVGRVAAEAGVPFVLDACQSAGQRPLDVDELGCDVLVATGRKFLRGPRGTGFLYVRERLIDQLEPPLLDLHSATWVADGAYAVRADARRFETWERSIAGVLGLGAAVDHALGWGLDDIAARVTALAERLRRLLTALAGVEVHDQGVDRCGIVTFSVAGHDADAVQRHLGSRRINTSVSRVDHARWDLAGRGLGDVVRASVHYVTTDDELGELVAGVAELAASAPGHASLGGR